jgi:hypothetical protein
VQTRLQETKAVWPGKKGLRGFNPQQGSRIKLYPTHLLSGAMSCGVCGNAIAQVSGKSSGYYGCLSATKGACSNRLLVKRTLAERVLVAGLRDRVLDTENVHYVLTRVEQEVARLYADAPETVRLKQAELQAEERKINNFVEFIGEGRGSRALAQALEAAEQSTNRLRAELDTLERARTSTFQIPPTAWVEERLATIQEVLERTTRSWGGSS